MCLLVTVLTQNRPDNHRHIPSQPEAPHPNPSSLSPPSPLPHCQLLHYSFPSLLNPSFSLHPVLLLHASPPLSSPPYTPITAAFPFSHSDLSCLLFSSLSQEVDWKRKRINKKASTSPAHYLARHRHGSMIPKKPSTLCCTPKGLKERGREKGERGGGGRK